MAPSGVITRAGTAVTDDPDPTALLTAGALCNNAALRPPDGCDGSWAAVGDPTDAALLAAAGKLSLDPVALSQELPRVAETKPRLRAPSHP